MIPRLIARAIVAGADWLLSPRQALAAAQPLVPIPASLLWAKTATDVNGPVTVSLHSMPADGLGLLVTADGHLTGVRLDRAEVQALRLAATEWLVGSARAVTR